MRAYTQAKTYLQASEIYEASQLEASKPRQHDCIFYSPKALKSGELEISLKCLDWRTLDI